MYMKGLNMLNLTKRENDIMGLLAEGKSNKEIAEALFISVHTVKSNLETIFYKLNLKNRVQLAVFYVKNLNK